MNKIEMAKAMLAFANISQIGMTSNQLGQMRDMAKIILLAEAETVKNSGCAEACYLLDGMMDSDAENDALMAKAAAMGHADAIKCVAAGGEALNKAFEAAVIEFNADND